MRLGGWPAAVLVVGLAIAGLQSALILMSWSHAGANDWYWRPFALGMVGVALSYLLVGTILLRKRPGNAVAAVLAAIGLSGLIYSLVSEWALWGLLVAPGSLPGAGIAGVLGQTIWVIPFSLVPILVLVYPTGRVLSPRWWWPAVPPTLAALAMVVAGTVAFWPLRDSGARILYGDPPDGGWVGELVAAVVPLYVLGLGGALVSVVIRWRRASGLERLQMKWLVPAGAILLSQAVAIMVPATGEVLGEVLLLAGLGSIPVVIGVAILRYRLYEIDRLVSRGVSYAIVTLALVGVYTLVVFLVGTVLSFDGELSVAASTLAVAALFSPLRRRIQDSVDRRFNRRRYDLGRIVEGFSHSLRGELEVTELAAQLRETTARTMEPASVSLWLRSGR